MKQSVSLSSMGELRLPPGAIRDVKQHLVDPVSACGALRSMWAARTSAVPAWIYPGKCLVQLHGAKQSLAKRATDDDDGDGGGNGVRMIMMTMMMVTTTTRTYAHAQAWTHS